MTFPKFLQPILGSKEHKVPSWQTPQCSKHASTKDNHMCLTIQSKGNHPGPLFLIQRMPFLFSFWQSQGYLSQRKWENFWDALAMWGWASRWLSIVAEADLQVLTSTLVSIASITRKAGAAECAASVVNAAGLVSRSTGMAAILTGVGRWGNH